MVSFSAGRSAGFRPEESLNVTAAAPALEEFKVNSAGESSPRLHSNLSSLLRTLRDGISRVRRTRAAH